MIHFHFFESEPRYLFLTYDEPSEKAVMSALENRLNKIPPFCFMPQFHGTPYKEEFLFKRLNSSGKVVHYCAIGLWQEVYKFLRDSKVPFDGLAPDMLKRTPEPFEDFKARVDSWGLKFPPRPYQYEAAHKILSWKQSLSKIATRAGKTLIAYMVFRYLIEKEGAKKILMIVPSVSLVKQGFNDFQEYAEFFKTECIWAGGEEVSSSNVTIGTFQSLIKRLEKGSSKYDPEWFDQFDVVFVDEVHRATATQIKTIISQPFFSRCKLVYGATGTLPKENTIEHIQVRAELGALIQTITAKELQDGGYISDIMIHQLRISYPDSDNLAALYEKAGEYLVSDYCGESGEKLKKGAKKALPEPRFLYKYYKRIPPGVELAKSRLSASDYVEFLKSMIKESDSTNNLLLERMIIHELPYRIKVLKGLIGDRALGLDGSEDTGNWLVLTHHKEYTEHVYRELSEAFPDKKLYKITGAVTPKKREEIVSGMKSGNSILVASYGCMSTGMTLPDLRYGVLFESFKSDVVNIQSLGRGLGRSEGKDKYEVWDFVDVLPTKKIWGQGREREKIYKAESYPYEIVKMKGIV